jgi:cation:H+ antiporter
MGGIAALFVGRVHVKDYLNRDVWISLLAAIAPLFLAMDKSISRVDGLILLMIYFAYATGFFKRRYEEIGKRRAEEGFVYRFMREFKHVEGVHKKEFIRLFLGLAILLFSADMIVKFSSQLAALANIPVFLIGLFVLAVGTSLPELAFSLRSLEDHEPQMFFGNLLGSTITNSTLIIGLTTLISPLEIVGFNEYIVAVLAFLVVFLLFWFFIRSKHRLDRWEALLLIAAYLIFVVLEFI